MSRVPESAGAAIRLPRMEGDGYPFRERKGDGAILVRMRSPSFGWILEGNGGR